MTSIARFIFLVYNSKSNQIYIWILIVQQTKIHIPSVQFKSNQYGQTVIQQTKLYIPSAQNRIVAEFFKYIYFIQISATRRGVAHAVQGIHAKIKTRDGQYFLRRGRGGGGGRSMFVPEYELKGQCQQFDELWGDSYYNFVEPNFSTPKSNFISYFSLIKIFKIFKYKIKIKNSNIDVRIASELNLQQQVYKGILIK